MRLVVISSWPTEVSGGSGTAVFFNNFTDGLRGRGYDLDIIAPNFSTDDYVAVTRQRFAFNRALSVDPRLRRADLIIGFDYDGYALDPACIPPYLVSAHAVYGDVVQWESGAIRTTVQSQARRDRVAMCHARAVAIGSQYAADRLMALYNVPDERIAMIPHGMGAPAWFAHLDDAPRAPNDHPVILSVGKMFPRKRVALTLRAVAQLLPRYPTLELRVIGDGIEEVALHAEADRLGIQAHVTWLGHIANDADFAREWRQADVLSHPSSQETFGFVYLEAMTVGLPIVAADAGAAPEVIGDAGLLTAPEDAGALAAALDSLLADPERRALYVARGKARATMFSYDRMLDSYEELIDRLVS